MSRRKTSYGAPRPTQYRWRLITRPARDLVLCVVSCPVVSASNLIEQSKNGSAPVLVDCRFNLLNPDVGWEAYLAGHIPGAVYAHLDKNLASPVTSDSGRHPLPTVTDFSKFVSSLGIDSDSVVVAYDDVNGAIASRFWWMLSTIGHRKVSVLECGIQSYIELGGELEKGEVQRPAADFQAEATDWPTVSSAQLQNNLSYTLIDARSKARFEGKEEPIDRVSGHIPAAKNLPFNSNLNADGTFLSAKRIRANFEAIESIGTPVLMCGSGVTACHLALARAYAKLPSVPLYAGSWSEWIADSSRPIETGPSQSDKL